MIELKDLIVRCAEVRASDLFIKEGVPPAMRRTGSIEVLQEFEELSSDDTQRLAYSVMTDDQIAEFELNHELDVGVTVPGVARLRINVFQQMGSIAMVVRLIPIVVQTIDELGLPQVLKKIVTRRQGLLLVTGPTGSGKSTTLAAMIDYINSTMHKHIITIEDPVEYVHSDRSCIISQREVGLDTNSFSAALKYVVRESPDVILIGEMRDAETMTVALQAAETGHLVFSTLHTNSASETIERIINIFPPHDKPQISLRLSNSLVGVVSQALVPRSDRTGRVAAQEIMIVTPTIAKLVEEGRSSQIYEYIDQGRQHWEMQTMNQCLVEYFKQGLISAEMALEYAGNRTEMRQMLRREAQ
jgi:twitching motility protein PilT